MRSSIIQASLLASLLFAVGTVGTVAQAADLRGPAPTEASLKATNGPFAISSSRVTLPSGYGGATVYYPSSKAEGKFGIVVLAPGFTASQSSYSWLATRVASHGFVVVNIDTTTTLDQPDSRATQMMAALNQVTNLSQRTSSAYYNVVDVSRRAVMGHSMGGGGTLTAATRNPPLRAAVPLTPWHTTKNFSGDAVPTMILACQSDTVAPNASHASAFYSSLKTSLPRAYVELAGADHFCPTRIASTATRALVGRAAISWLKLFVDQDERYRSLLNATGGSAYSSVKKSF